MDCWFGTELNWSSTFTCCGLCVRTVRLLHPTLCITPHPTVLGLGTEGICCVVGTEGNNVLLPTQAVLLGNPLPFSLTFCVWLGCPCFWLGFRDRTAHPGLVAPSVSILAQTVLSNTLPCYPSGAVPCRQVGVGILRSYGSRSEDGGY